jgi:hypothetical protein
VAMLLTQFTGVAVPAGALVLGAALLGALVLPPCLLRWWTPFTTLAGAAAVLLLARPALGTGSTLLAALGLASTAYLIAVMAWCRVERAQHAAALVLGTAAALAPEAGVPWEIRVAAIAAAGILAAVPAVASAAPARAPTGLAFTPDPDQTQLPAAVSAAVHGDAAALATMKHAIFTVCGSLCLLVAYALARGLATYGEPLVSPPFIIALILVGGAAWLALGPFFLWWCELAQYLPAAVLAAMIVTIGPSVAVLLLELWQRYPYLAPGMQAAGFSLAAGALTSLVGGWSLYAARTSSQRLASLWLYSGGLVLCGLAAQTPAGITLALVALAFTQVLAAMQAAAASVPCRLGGLAELFVLAAVAGLPPLPGFVVLAGALQITTQSHRGTAVILSLAAVLAAAAAVQAGRAVAQAGTSGSRTPTPFSTGQRVRLTLLLLPAGAMLALGLFPAPLVATFAAVAARLVFTH